MNAKGFSYLFTKIKDFFSFSSAVDTTFEHKHILTSSTVTVDVFKEHTTTVIKVPDISDNPDRALQQIADHLKVPVDSLEHIKDQLLNPESSSRKIKDRVKQPLAQIQCEQCQHHTASTQDWCMYCGEKLSQVSGTDSHQIVEQEPTESVRTRDVTDPLKVRLRHM